MKTLQSKISNSLNRISEKAFGDSAVIRNILKPSVVKLLNIITFGRGININIGGQGIYKMSPEFYFSNWENFGDRHNGGFVYCLEQSKDKKSVLDVGAHIGLYSLPLSQRISPDGKIYAFEPSTVNRGYLKKHLELNDINNVEVYPYLVGKESNDSIDFYEDTTQVNPMGGLVWTKNIATTAEVVQKKMVTLDDFCLEKDIQPELIKVDVEGAEIDLLYGGKNIICKCLPIIVLSLHPNHIKLLGQSLNELTSFLDKVNYQCLTLDGGDNSKFLNNECVLIPN
jgi:FkbM family methyltransferase